MFRSYSQWLGAFLKYASAAIASRQLTSARSFADLNTISKLFEEEDKDVEWCCVVALLYDEAFWSSIAHRVMAKDLELDMDAAFASVDKAILGACKTKVTTRARSLADDQIDKAKNADRVYNQAQWRMDEQWERPDFDRSKAKKNVWLLGKIAEKRKKKMARWHASGSVEEGGYQDVSEDESVDERPPLRRRR